MSNLISHLFLMFQQLTLCGFACIGHPKRSMQSSKQLLTKIAKKFQESSCARVLVLIKLQATNTLAQVISLCPNHTIFIKFFFFSKYFYCSSGLDFFYSQQYCFLKKLTKRFTLEEFFLEKQACKSLSNVIALLPLSKLLH